MKKDAKIYVAGHTGLAGSAIVRELRQRDFQNLVLATHDELDLRNQKATAEFFKAHNPEYVFFAAGRVGGLTANNTQRADFIYDNLQMQINVIHSAWVSGVSKLLYLSSNCAYPRECDQPMRETDLMTGKFEPTNQPFAVAKIAGIEMCTAFNQQYGAKFISLIPASLFGPGDNYDMVNSHIIPTLIKRSHDAKVQNQKSFQLPGSPDRRRELLYSGDLADACIFLMDNYDSPEPINVGVGKDHTIKEISDLVKEVTGYSGEVIFDTGKPSGMMRKLLNSSRIRSLGWHPKTSLEEGMILAYEWFMRNK